MQIIQQIPLKQKQSKQITSGFFPKLSPRAVISKLTHQHKNIYVLRDDLLSGGTKQRACGQLLSQLSKNGYEHFVYASPFSGFAQIALAYVCQEMGLRCTLFCEKDQAFSGTDQNQFHEFSLLAQKYGAEIILVHSLAEASMQAQNFASKSKDRLELPLGFDCNEFRSALKEEVTIMWNDMMSDLPAVPKNMWLPVGSGTLAKTIRSVIPLSIQIQCVNVRVLNPGDIRLDQVKSLPQTHFHDSSLLFQQPCKDLPSIPSNLYYDAKLWSFIKNFATDGDVWWNVAR